MKHLLILYIMMFGLFSNAQNPEAYKLYNNKGKEIKFSKMTDDIAEADVVLFGELHNNSMNHWLELQVAKALFDKKKLIQLGAEMFEADDQLAIDEYFQGLFKENNFEKEVKLWNNYKTDYKPLLDFAKTNKLDFIATNIPRRYASMVPKDGFEGLETLSDAAKKYIAPLPVQFDTLVPNYKEMLEMDMGHAMNKVNFAKAQAIKDATMAYFITENLKPGHTFIHYNGEFHSKLYGAISWYLRIYKPEVKIVTISTQEADNTDFKDEYKAQGDFIFVIPSDMTKTY
ncbi:MAG: ChaN family lipoprotein [Saprospiraceae bacterium]|nr:ChaN family lipoprotein [Saprospiraceae bacterium]